MTSAETLALDSEKSQGDQEPNDLGNPEVKPTVSIRPPKRWQAIDFKELWAFRDLLSALAIRDVKLRYKQTMLGAAWVVLQPLMGAGIFTFVFGVMAQLPTDGLPPFLVSFAGMFAWTAFSQTLSKTSGCMVGNQNMIQKVYFPRLILPLAQVYSVLVDLAVSLVMVAILLAIYQINPGWPILLLPIWMIAIFMFALGVGMWTGALMVEYRDVRYVLPVVIQFAMYASPVGYMIVAVNEKVPAWAIQLYMLNPLASLIEGCRWSMLGTGSLHSGYTAYSLILSVTVFVVGAYIFRGMERKFADVI
jgi:lipopolysaccharide transport system permease protein